MGGANLLTTNRRTAVRFDCDHCKDMRWLYLPSQHGSGGVSCPKCNADGLLRPAMIGGKEIKPDMSNPLWRKWRARKVAERI